MAGVESYKDVKGVIKLATWQAFYKFQRKRYSSAHKRLECCGNANAS
jgi:hypothetical protein